MINFFPNKKAQALILLVVIVLQFSRILIFVNQNGGLIQDSGWSLGIARSLAERGTYTTMVATFADPTVTAGINPDGDFHIQDSEGRVFFRSDRPALIIPQAILFKIFGFNFWTYRAGSLLFFLIFLVVASVLLWQVYGLLTALFLHLFLYSYPHLLIYLTFQTLGEMAALAYLMLAFALFLVAQQRQAYRRKWWFLAAGVMAGLALYSKLIAALALSALGLLGLFFLYQKRATFKDALFFGLGTLLFPLFWELTQLIVIIRLVNLQAYLGHISHRYNFFQDYGRDTTEAQQSFWIFAWDKFKVITEISQPNLILAGLTLLIMLVGGGYLLWRWRNDPLKFGLTALIWFGWLIHHVWFVLRSTGGVTRYNWISLVLGVMVLSIVAASAVGQLARWSDWRAAVLSLAILLLLLANLWSQSLALSPLISDDLIEFWRQKHIYSDYIQMPSMIIPSQAQEEVIDFIDDLGPDARVFYALGYHNGEIAAQTGRIFYPLERRVNMPPRSGDVVIINPGIISSWRKPPNLEAAILAEVEQRCPNMIFRNGFYILCGLD
ncbi:MAG: glycosyltransferase family 39 protein [Anaerolineae bacterium]|nr:glycosyltransferase family 39 protein [Anaerolineae bacterium]